MLKLMPFIAVIVIPTSAVAMSKQCFELIQRPAGLQLSTEHLPISASAKPELENLEIIPGWTLKSLLDSDAGVTENLTIREHNQLVQTQKSDYFRILQKQLSAEFVESMEISDLIDYAIRWHDIGKPLAIAAGDKGRQHEFTIPLLKKINAKFALSRKQEKLLLALIGNDEIGQLIQGNKTVTQAYTDLNRLAEQAGIAAKDFFQLQAFFYSIDASSYPRLAKNLFVPNLNYLLIRAPAFHELAEKFGVPNDPDWGIRRQKMLTALDVLRKSVSADIRATWKPERFSDPAHHNQHQYRYIVHASSSVNFYDSMLTARDLGSFESIQMSVIDQNANNTFAGAGVILDVPEDCILVGNERDMLSSDSQIGLSPEYRFERVFKKHGLPSAEAILKASYSHPTIAALQGHNELLGVGQDPNGHRIKIKGVFIKVDSLGRPLVKPALYKTVTAAAQKAGLPLLLIGPPEGFVTVRSLTTYGDPMVEKPVIVLASPQEFDQLKEKATRLHTRIIGMTPDFIMTNGVINQNDFYVYQKLNSIDEAILKPGPFRKQIILNAPPDPKDLH